MSVTMTMRFRTQMLRALSGLALVLLLPGGPAAAQPQDACASRLPAERVTLNLRDASVATALRLLAQQYKVNMLVTEDVRGQVTLDFFRVPAHDVFQAIIDAGNLRCVVSGDVLRVSTMTRLRTEEEDRVKAREGELRLEADTRRKIVEARRAEEELAELAGRGPIREETIRLQYADAEDVAKTLQGILGILPQGSTQSAVPLPQLSQLYVPSPPIDIPSSPPPPLTAPSLSPASPSEIVAKGLTVQAYKPTNSLFIRYYEKDIERLKKLIQERLDIPVPQVQIAAQMVITSLNALEQIGVQWGGAGAGNVGRSTFVGQGFQDPVRVPGTGAINVNPVNPNLNLGGLLPVNPATGMPLGGNLVNLPTSLLPTLAGATPAGGLLLGIIGSNFNINLAIQALEVQGKARTLAEPKTVTLENAKAMISRGFEVPFVSTPSQGLSQVQFKEALLKLEVTPRVIRDNGDTRIRMKVVFENNEPDFTALRSVNGNPSIFKRRQETEVLISQGQRLVVGGVTNDTSALTTREVPVFGRIPMLGWLFKSRETSRTGEELIVILTPSVLDVGAAARR
jgi:type IV pilus assembly protein PilQ